jgi:N-methylhydantoinase A
VAEEAVVFASGRGHDRTQTRVYQRADLAAGDVFAGPAIIEQADSTTVIPPDGQAYIDEIGNILLSVEPG